MKLKGIAFLIAAVTFASCAQSEKPVGRLPSSVNLIEVKRCGKISTTENSHTALDAEDIMYSLTLDCNGDRRVSLVDGGLIIGIEKNQLRSNQNNYLAQAIRREVAVTKNAKASPYVCVKVQAEGDPCDTGKNTLGYHPSFSGLVSQRKTTKR